MVLEPGPQTAGRVGVGAGSLKGWGQMLRTPGNLHSHPGAPTALN